jgi:hypothetical protein
MATTAIGTLVDVRRDRAMRQILNVVPISGLS